MSEKKKKKEIDNEPVGSVSLQNEVRTDELSFIDHGLYNWDPVSSLCFTTFLCPEQKLMVTEAGSFSLPLFLEEKCFCINIRYMLYAEYLSLYPYSG